MTIELREITDANREAVIALHAGPGEGVFVSSVADSILEAAEHPEGSPWYRAVYLDGVPVGFVMLSWDVTPQPPDIIGPWFLWKLIVDEPHQGRGIGRAIVERVVELIRAEGATELFTSHVVAAGGPDGFYERLGFVPTGAFDPQGERILRLDLTRIDPQATASVDWRRRDVQIGLLFAVVVITAIATMTVSLLFPEPGEGGFFSYASVEPDRAFVWGLLTLAAVNVVLSVVAAALVFLLLTPRRGWQWATAGFATAMVGCALYAIGVGGWAMLYFFATDSPALDPATASAFIESVNADAFHLFAAPFGGAIFGTLATLLFAVGLWRSGNLPKWVIVLAVVGSIVTFLPPEGVVGALLELPQAMASVVAAWFLWRQRHELLGGAGRNLSTPTA